MTLLPTLVDYARILAARDVIAGRVHRTPVVTSSYLGRQLGVRLHLKLELFQKTGSFKVRGVLNKLHHLGDDERQKGVISLSAGNHAQALAWGASQWGISSTIVMPATSVRSKVEATQGYGGKVVLTENNLLETCLSIQEERGLVLVHPFDDPDIIAGQGTVGVEILEDVADVDVVVVGVGGGGIISGVAAAVKAKKPHARVVGVEPNGAPTMSRSLARGAPAQLAEVDTIADGLAAPFAGEHTFAHVKALVDDMVTVPDAEIRRAMGLIIERCKVIPEPAAAAGLAALLSRRVQVAEGASVLCLLSGGNADRDLLKSLL
ncbi:MAG: threonine/serine dehydratase [Candidatus Krumholzibacteriia bacterium]